jgi:catechol 2,3-dioxygenase-like lactoylglutathione lyase family enzyme
MNEPKVAIGHVTLRVSDLEGAVRFYEKLGLKHVAHGGVLEIMELRGGTHLLLFRARGKPRKGPIRSFDLMVDDLASTHAGLVSAGVPCTDIHKDRWSSHRCFEVTDPDGHVLSFVSGHEDEDEHVVE